MKNLLNLIIKIAFTLLILFLLIPIFGKSTWTQIIVTGLVLAVLSYLLGDLWILPKYSNFLAVLVDFGVSVMVIWIMMKALPQFVLTMAGVWIIALVFAVGECLFHFYLEATHAPRKKIESS